MRGYDFREGQPTKLVTMNKMMPTKSITMKTSLWQFGSAPRVVTFIQTRGGIEHTLVTEPLSQGDLRRARLKVQRPGINACAKGSP
jgi:hypothetical protein